jgi:5-(carboxyamino)imidazole ribonucleotide synthase
MTHHPSPITHHPIEPGSTIGVLGGGQLGAMFAREARRLGFRVAVWDSDPDAPALKVADAAVAALFDDAAALARFRQSLRAVTYEWENIPVALVETLERELPVRPSATILEIIQNRITQKTTLERHGIPVAPFHAVAVSSELAVPGEVGYPCLGKTATAGYDGKGQWRLAGPGDASRLRQELAQQQYAGALIIERFLSFEKELSVMVVRSAEGEVRSYPVAENIHEGGILRTTSVPAEVGLRLSEQAALLAREVVETLGGVGVFCVELFLMPDGRLFINEVAPRPHNSGHYTLDACTVSQFEQQVRVVCGLPLGEVRLLCPAAMVNLIGDDFPTATSGERLRALFDHPGAKLHVYGKKSVRPGRKMGHVTFLAEKPEAARQAAQAFRTLLNG